MTVTATFVLILFATSLVSDARIMDLFLRGNHYRQFVNASFGLEHDENFSHQCGSSGTVRISPNRKSPKEMAFTANRRAQDLSLNEAALGNLQLGVILALGGHSSGHYDYGPAGSLNGLMAVWDSWRENFFSQTSNTSSLVLLLDERDFLHQNVTKSVADYLDILLIKNMGAVAVECSVITDKTVGFSYNEGSSSTVSIKRTIPPQPEKCNNKLAALDQGYHVYYVDVATPSNPNQAPLIIFAGVHRFAAPLWAKDMDEESLYVHWRPHKLNRRFPTNYGYVKMTNWYAYHMLNLQLLDFFDYASKLDNDVSFVAPFPEPNLPHKLAKMGVKMLGTQNVWYHDDARVVQGISQCLNSYIDDESTNCQKKLKKYVSENKNKEKKDGIETVKGFKVPASPSLLWLIPGGQNATVFWEGNLNTTFRAHFLVFWLGLYAAPEVKSMARYWNDWHPKGMWDYRWGDQQWWPRPLSVYGSGNLEKDLYQYEDLNTDTGAYVVHKLWPRYGTVAKSNYFNYNGSTVQDRDLIYNISSKKQSKYRPF